MFLTFIIFVQIYSIWDYIATFTQRESELKLDQARKCANQARREHQVLRASKRPQKLNGLQVRLSHLVLNGKKDDHPKKTQRSR
jgi:hypothetical protein